MALQRPLQATRPTAISLALSSIRSDRCAAVHLRRSRFSTSSQNSIRTKRILPNKRFCNPGARTATSRNFSSSSAVSSSSQSSSSSSSWAPSPAPPRLPAEEQRLYEDLQRRSTGAFSTPKDVDAPLGDTTSASSPSSSSQQQGNQKLSNPSVDASAKSDPLHPDVRRGAPPEFKGDVNPVTGEVGGPKNNPLRWGHGGDWSYNGRVTDF